MSRLHVHLLVALRGAGKFGISAEALLTDMRRGVHRDLSLPDLERALRDLADKSLVATFNDTLEEKRWRIAAIGEAALKEASL